VPPYLLASGPDDPACAVSLELMATTARYMRRNGVNLPLLPIFCGQHRAFAAESAWKDGRWHRMARPRHPPHTLGDRRPVDPRCRDPRAGLFSDAHLPAWPPGDAGPPRAVAG
jgi:hypothetical protein